MKVAKQNSSESAGERLFDVFRRLDKPLMSGEPTASDIHIQLLFDDAGAYLEIVNGKGHPCEVDYRGYHGAVRDLLKTLRTIHERQGTVIDW